MIFIIWLMIFLGKNYFSIILYFIRYLNICDFSNDLVQIIVLLCVFYYFYQLLPFSQYYLHCGNNYLYKMISLQYDDLYLSAYLFDTA